MLITKLRSANTAETRQYRKASKALLVLIPLFGLTYLIVLYGPNEGMGRKIFDIARAFLLSTQVAYTLINSHHLWLFEHSTQKILKILKNIAISSLLTKNYFIICLNGIDYQKRRRRRTFSINIHVRFSFLCLLSFC